MDRQELLRQAAQTYLTPCYQNAASLALAAFTEQQEEILGGLSRRVSGLVETVRQQQERGEKKALRYLVVSSLFSSTVTRSYEYEFALYDSELYLDPTESCFYWAPEFLFRQVEQDMACFAEQAGRELVRIRAFELEEVRRMYVNGFHPAAGLFLQQVLPNILEQNGLFSLSLEQEFSVHFGIYMEQRVESAAARGGKFE